MILSGENDIRKVVYPYLYQTKVFTLPRSRQLVEVYRRPQIEEGKNLANAIYETAAKHADDPTPAKVTAFEGNFMGKKLTVKIVKNEEKKTASGSSGA